MEIFQAVVMSLIVGFLYKASLAKNCKKTIKTNNSKNVRNSGFLKIDVKNKI